MNQRREGPMKSNYLRHFVTACICLSAVLGSRTVAAQSGVAPCSLLTSAQVTAPHMIVTLSLWDGSKWDQMKTPVPGMTRTAVSGLGDDAFYTTMGPASGKQTATLSVKKGSTAYLIKVYGPNVTDEMSMEKALAGNVLAN